MALVGSLDVGLGVRAEGLTRGLRDAGRSVDRFATRTTEMLGQISDEFDEITESAGEVTRSLSGTVFRNITAPLTGLGSAVGLLASGFAVLRLSSARLLTPLLAIFTLFTAGSFFRAIQFTAIAAIAAGVGFLVWAAASNDLLIPLLAVAGLFAAGAFASGIAAVTTAVGALVIAFRTLLATSALLLANPLIRALVIGGTAAAGLIAILGGSAQAADAPPSSLGASPTGVGPIVSPEDVQRLQDGTSFVLDTVEDITTAIEGVNLDNLDFAPIATSLREQVGPALESIFGEESASRIESLFERAQRIIERLLLRLEEGPTFVEALSTSLETLGSRATAIQGTVGAITSGIQSFSTALVQGMSSFTDLFLGIIAQILSVILSALIANALLGLITAGASTAVNAGATAEATSTFGAITAALGGLAGRQFGGPVQAGRPFIVGEAGPELFVPTTSGTVEPNVDGQGGSFIQSANLQVNINSVGQDSGATAEQLDRAVVSRLNNTDRAQTGHGARRRIR